MAFWHCFILGSFAVVMGRGRYFDTLLANLSLKRDAKCESEEWNLGVLVPLNAFLSVNHVQEGWKAWNHNQRMVVVGLNEFETLQHQQPSLESLWLHCSPLPVQPDLPLPECRRQQGTSSLTLWWGSSRDQDLTITASWACGTMTTAIGF